MLNLALKECLNICKRWIVHIERKFAEVQYDEEEKKKLKYIYVNISLCQSLTFKYILSRNNVLDWLVTMNNIKENIIMYDNASYQYLHSINTFRILENERKDIAKDCFSRTT